MHSSSIKTGEIHWLTDEAGIDASCGRVIKDILSGGHAVRMKKLAQLEELGEPDTASEKDKDEEELNNPLNAIDENNEASGSTSPSFFNASKRVSLGAVSESQPLGGRKSFGGGGGGGKKGFLTRGMTSMGLGKVDHEEEERKKTEEESLAGKRRSATGRFSKMGSKKMSALSQRSSNLIWDDIEESGVGLDPVGDGTTYIRKENFEGYKARQLVLEHLNVNGKKDDGSGKNEKKSATKELPNSFDLLFFRTLLDESSGFPTLLRANPRIIRYCWQVESVLKSIAVKTALRASRLLLDDEKNLLEKARSLVIGTNDNTTKKMTETQSALSQPQLVLPNVVLGSQNCN